MKHLNIRVHGQVQGVNFRNWTRQQAHDLGVNGFVRNEPDGTVYLEAEGDDLRVDQLVQALQAGSPAAVVSSVSTEADTLKDFSGFEVRA